MGEDDVPGGSCSRPSVAALDVSAQRETDGHPDKLVPRRVTLLVCGCVLGGHDGDPRPARCLTLQAHSHTHSCVVYLSLSHLTTLALLTEQFKS